jgi:hypothetical protein
MVKENSTMQSALAGDAQDAASADLHINIGGGNNNNDDSAASPVLSAIRMLGAGVDGAVASTDAASKSVTTLFKSSSTAAAPVIAATSSRIGVAWQNARAQPPLLYSLTAAACSLPALVMAARRGSLLYSPLFRLTRDVAVGSAVVSFVAYPAATTATVKEGVEFVRKAMNADSATPSSSLAAAVGTDAPFAAATATLTGITNNVQSALRRLTSSSKPSDSK